jgi:hypothetical protein
LKAIDHLRIDTTAACLLGAKSGNAVRYFTNMKLWHSYQGIASEFSAHEEGGLT